MKIIQLNTDGIMVSLDDCDVPVYQEITQEWQDRTGFELEEDLIKMICQKDVNNYVEVPFEGDPKIKGGVLVRGIAPAGAFNINNNACVVAQGGQGLSGLRYPGRRYHHELRPPAGLPVGRQGREQVW